MNRWLIAGGLIVFALGVASPTLAQPNLSCRDLSIHTSARNNGTLLEEHHLLYSYAMIAGIPDQIQHSCSSSDLSNSFGEILSSFSSVEEADLRAFLFGEWEARGDPNGVRIYKDGSRGSDVYVSCQRDIREQAELFLGMYWDRQSVLKIRVLLRHGGLFIGLMEPIVLSLDERQTLEVVDAGTIMAVGNANSLNEKATAIAEILGKSCAFDFLTHFAGHLGRDRDGLIVVGHSLGGAAAQHVVTQLGGQSTSLSGYAFSSFGLDSGVDSTLNVVSYYVRGDFIAELPDRKQVGRVLEFIPRPRRAWTRGKALHSLNTVRDGLCECIAGRRHDVRVRED